MADFQSAPLSVLRVGAALRSPIYDPQDRRQKLLGAGVVISEDLLTRLRNRGVRAVVLNTSDLARLSCFEPQGTATEAPLDHDHVLSLLENEASQDVDRRVDGGELPELAAEEAFAEKFEKPAATSFDPDAMNEFAEANERNVDYLDGVFRGLVDSKSPNPEGLHAICRDSLAAASRDIDLFVCLGANPCSTDYPCRHGLHVASLAIAIGARMGLGQEALHLLAVGCLLHDIGMLQVPKEIYGATRRLSKKEVAQIADHPVRTMGMLESQRREIPFLARIVAYQIHERCDGSGYPRGRTADHIHPLAKIGSIADAFVGLAAKRPHRAGIQPYYVMAKLLHSVRDGLFDPGVMRGLLGAVSMFPIGSFVETNDGRVGRVIRSSGDTYDRPIVELWEKRSLADAASVVDLSEKTELKIVRPLPKMAA